MVSNTHHMKKILISVTFLLALASLSYAADTKHTAVKKSVENKSVLTGNTSAVAASSYAAVVEENTKLKLQAEELMTRIEDLRSKLEYTQMMHSTINSLSEAVVLNKMEEIKSQVDYVRMMTATLLSLQNETGNK